MSQSIFTFLLFALTSLPLNLLNDEGQEAEASLTPEYVMNKMFMSVKNLDYAQFNMITSERVDGELLVNKSFCIVQFHPKKVFLRGFDEDGELKNEILYVEGENDNEALISPNGFPYVNLSLNPIGGTMRKNRHFTILEAGGEHLVNMLQFGLDHTDPSTDTIKRFSVEKVDADHIKLLISNPDYGFVSYTCESSDNLRSLSMKLGVPEYKLMEINSNIDEWDESLTGSVIQVPNHYAKKLELIIRTEDYIPLKVSIFDEKGLYSVYNYTSFNCHPKITNQTFSRDNPAYTF